MLEADASAVVVLVVAPSEEVLESRLRQRGDPEEHVERRLALGRREVAEARPLAGHVVVNDELDRAVEALSAIIEDARRKSASA